MTFRNAGWLSLAGAVLALGCAAGVRAADRQADRPGEVAVTAAPEPSLLRSLLPAFTVAPLDRAPEVDGWSPLRLSPAGRFCLADLKRGGLQSVQLLDGNGSPLRDLTAEASPLATGVWGYSEQHILLEARAQPEARPRYLHLDRVTGAITPAPFTGLPHWSPSGKDYWQAQSAGVQRFAGDNSPVGHVLTGRDPSWSGDGQWLAYVAARPRSEDGPAAAAVPDDVRVVPARGDVARVVIAGAGWERFLKEKGWREARGPESLAWSPTGDALFAFLNVRAESGEGRYLVRLDMHGPHREAIPVPTDTRLVTASGDGRHWIVQLGDRLYRLDFAPASVPAPTRKSGSAEPAPRAN